MCALLRHNCGLVVTHNLHDVYTFIKSLQHRGREAAGIAAIGHNRIDVVKWLGKVDAIKNETLHEIFDASEYHTFFAHVRYATKGRKDKLLEDAHPHVIGGEVIDYGTHIHIRDCDMAAIHNGQVNFEDMPPFDKSLLKTGCDTEALLHCINNGMNEVEMLKKIKGAYTLAIADKKKDAVIVVRDRTGIRPGVLGWKDGKYVVASESIALEENGAELREDLEPGAIYYLDSSGSFSKKKIIDGNISHCFFEWNYLGHKKSRVDGVSVFELRLALGEKLADEFRPEDADYVTFIPEAPIIAARGYAKKTGLKYKTIFYKLKDERAFQGSTSEERKASISKNLYIRPSMFNNLKGSTLVIIDDSFVRGTNSKYAVDLLFNVGVKKIYLVSYTPPIGVIGSDSILRGCKWGVDMAPDDNFIARYTPSDDELRKNPKLTPRNRSSDEIAEKLSQGIPPGREIKVVYLSTEGMLKAFESQKMHREKLCTYCIGGKKPF